MHFSLVFVAGCEDNFLRFACSEMPNWAQFGSGIKEVIFTNPNYSNYLFAKAVEQFSVHRILVVGENLGKLSG